MNMEVHGRSCSSETVQSEEEMDLRRGPWTLEEDLLLMNYIATHGEGRWNLLARCAGLKRTGKSCRLRWLNYLRPDVRRGNITPEEQLLILELHSRWGNRWSRIAQHLPGRTDNEIKNYWRTRVQKHAKHLQCDVDSKQFKDVMRYLWIPRLIERIQAGSSYSPATLPPAEYGIVSGGCDHTCGNVEPWNAVECTAESSSSSWKSAMPSTMSSGSSAAGFQVAEKRKGGDGIMDAPPPQMKWPDESSALSQGLPELEQYWGQEGDDISDNFWNAEDIWYLHS